MIMWLFIFLGMLLASVAGIIYLMTRFRRSALVLQLVGGRRKLALLFGFVVVSACAAGIYVIWGFWNLAFVLMHVMGFFIVADLIGWRVEKKKEKKSKYYVAGLLALLVSVTYLGAGIFFAYHVFETDYALTTEKNLGADSLRIVGFTDSHVGTTFHWQKFATYVEQMNAKHPDLVVIGGDYVDDGTSYEDMVNCCKALGKLETTYGVYYVWGNHDEGYYAGPRGYDGETLRTELEANGVTVLDDEVVSFGNIYLAGRLDRDRNPNRQTIDNLLAEVPEDAYTIVLNHQPNDYANEALSKADLVISGHTHGGQALPVNYLGKWTGLNDAIYGSETRNGTDFLVSSGISDWEFIFKTGCIAEYVVIDIAAK